jgi:hypothetical protein
MDISRSRIPYLAKEAKNTNRGDQFGDHDRTGTGTILLLRNQPDRSQTYVHLAAHFVDSYMGD